MGQGSVLVAAGPIAPAGHRCGLVVLAAFVTLLNAAKPLTVDDAVYYKFAVHIAEAE